MRNNARHEMQKTVKGSVGGRTEVKPKSPQVKRDANFPVANAEGEGHVM